MRKLKKLIKNPVKFYKDAKKKKRMLRDISLSKKAYLAVHINVWKRPIMQSWFPERDFFYLPNGITEEEFAKRWLPALQKATNPTVLVWGMHLPRFLRDRGIPICYVEDGFIRSVPLGANHSTPLSLNFDTQAPYFNSEEKSDLEDLLNNHVFLPDDPLLKKAERLINKILVNNISKYNGVKPGKSIYPEPKERKRILVVGQVEDDASIVYGSQKKYTNVDLIRVAVEENPGAEVYYKPHPDVFYSKRKKLSEPDEVGHLCQLIHDDVALSDALNTIDHLYTITSQVGFEALLRGVKVTTMGCPFYSCWGLTDDRQISARRTKKRTITEMFAIAYIVYPIYKNPLTFATIDLDDALDLIVAERDKIVS